MSAGSALSKPRQEDREFKVRSKHPGSGGEQVRQKDTRMPQMRRHEVSLEGHGGLAGSVWVWPCPVWCDLGHALL